MKTLVLLLRCMFSSISFGSAVVTNLLTVIGGSSITLGVVTGTSTLRVSALTITAVSMTTLNSLSVDGQLTVATGSVITTGVCTSSGASSIIATV